MLAFIIVQLSAESRCFDASNDEHPVRFVLDTLNPGIYDGLMTWLNEMSDDMFTHPCEFKWPVFWIKPEIVLEC